MTNKSKIKSTKIKQDSSLIAYQGIRRMLYAKELVPGQKFNYTELVDKLKLSPTPIIQALKWMELEGFVVHEPNRGYAMTPFSLDELEELYELRELIEPSLIPSTIERIDKNGLVLLKQALDAHLAAEKEYFLRERLFKNKEFHLTLANLSGKKTQIRVLNNIFDMLFLKYGGDYLPTSSVSSTDQAHQEIYDAIAVRSQERAMIVLKNHITNVKIQVLTSVKKVLAEREKPIF
ncbi:MAG: GntR family transcriptional regulator [Syntrophorhabdaceae bacterium]|nr:GntR family transcriptional regulator [Syntrophorhabdaceae bacterium]